MYNFAAAAVDICSNIAVSCCDGSLVMITLIRLILQFSIAIIRLHTNKSFNYSTYNLFLQCKESFPFLVLMLNSTTVGNKRRKTVIWTKGYGPFRHRENLVATVDILGETEY